MARPRTGTYQFMPSTRSFHGRVTATDESGKTIRPWVDLHTADDKEARRKVEKLNADVNRAPIAELMRFQGYALAWLAARIGREVAQAPSEKGWLHNHILPVLGQLYLADVRPSHVLEVIDKVIAKGLGRQTVVHVRNVMLGIFKQAVMCEFVDTNPVEKVPVPEMREVEKDREILTDEEIALFFACDTIDIEIRLMGLVARVEGGMRTRDLTAWMWTMIDRRCYPARAAQRDGVVPPGRLPQLPARVCDGPRRQRH